MPPPLNVDREALKTLALAVGITEASKRTGVSHQALRKWSSREGWFAPPKLPPTLAPIPVTNVTKPSHALALALSERHRETKLGLSKYTKDAATKLAKSKGNLRNTRPAKDIADIMGKIWPEQQSSNAFNLNILTGSASFQFEEGKEQ